ncbi:hypothetical protein C8R46DRAFT_496858 [Mycena filopes]|nr:hypothetical protein C8R46DRAFT_496858 [Mycena filopes]
MLEKVPTHAGRGRNRWQVFSKGLWTLLVLATTTFILFTASQPFHSRLRALIHTWSWDFPHSSFFVAETDITLVANRSAVVQPLIGANDTFDIAVTVWQLATAREEEEERRRQALVQPEYLGYKASEEDAFRVVQAAMYNHVAALEKSVFSDIVFRGLRLSDAAVYANVSFQIPTEIFRKHPGNNNDLRASFMILPHSPGPFDYYKSYTSLIPDEVNRPRFKSLPFPKDSPTEFHRRLRDLALDSFAFTIPLLERHAVGTRCGEAQRPDEEEVRQTHPHVVTRTHLRIIRETRLFRRELYLSRHEHMRSISCRKSMEAPPHLDYCTRMYLYNGNWETMLHLAVPDPEAVGGFRQESAYAPFMDAFAGAAGPKDIIPVSINRERCAKTEDVADHMNITWRLSVSSVSPRNYLLADMLQAPPLRSNHTDTEYERALKQDAAENFAILHGLRHREDSHPRRRLAQHILFVLSYLLFFVLSCTYWVTRTSTTGISVPGTACIGAAGLISLASQLYKRPSGAQAVVALELGLEPLLVLKAISRLEVTSVGGLPRIRWVPATHQERTSARLDARTDWRWKCGIFAVLAAAFHGLNLTSTMFIAPVAPHTIAADDVSAHYANNVAVLAEALKLTGVVLQLVLNYGGKVFAGQYKAGAFMGVVSTAVRHAASVSWLVGRSEVMPGIPYAEVLWDGVLGVTCWQAWRYSSKLPEDEDEG